MPALGGNRAKGNLRVRSSAASKQLFFSRGFLAHKKSRHPWSFNERSKG